MSHYFISDPSLASNIGIINYEICGKKLSLYTDNGVFSKAKLDEGSDFLIKTVLPLRLGNSLLDMGCGIGPIGLTIALLKEDVSHVTMCDVNTRALELAKKNAEHLGVKDKVSVLESDVFTNIEGKFDSILTNPPIRAGKRVTYAIYRESKDHLLSGGSLYVVIRKAQGAESASKYIKEIFGNIMLLGKHKGYYIYQAINQ